jgi:hypothetical protein
VTRALEQRAPAFASAAMPVKIRTSGCLISIVASIVLTVLLNLGLRACTG